LKRLGFVFFSGFALVAAGAGPASAAPCGSENLLAGKKPQLASETKGDIALITDGAVGPEGAQWDAPVVVTFETPTSAVTYDLGEVRSISAVVVQADANDVYKISGSVDGAPSSYKPITELANVVSKGHGLRTRAVEFASSNVRYLRLGESAGDGYFSVSEFAAYCSKPNPFPPSMKIVDAPAAQVGQGAPATAASSKDGGRSFLLLAVAALGLAWLAYRTIKRGSAAKPSDGGPAASEPSASSGDPEKPAGESGSSGGPAGPGGAA
jgi:hypothetical protein